MQLVIFLDWIGSEGVSMSALNDLASKHCLAGSLITNQQVKGDWNRFKISQKQIDSYHDTGFLSGIKLLETDQVDVLLDELADIQGPDCSGRSLFYEFNSNESVDPTRVLFHALGAWRVSPAFHDILWNPAFTVPASQLLGGPVRFWHDQLFCKPAKHGGVVAWHQDYSYWTRTKPMEHLTCWIALDDASIDNGCLHYVPRSHRWDLLPITGLAGDMDAIKEVLTPDQWHDFNNPVPIEIKKGYATFHHPLLVHGSFANSTDRQRRATVINVFSDGVFSDSNEPLLHGVPVVPKGQTMGGKFFPLLFDPKCGIVQHE